MGRNIIQTAHLYRVEIRAPGPIAEQAKEIAKRINAAIPAAELLTIETIRGIQDADTDAVSLIYRPGDWNPAAIVEAINADISPIFGGLDYSIFERETRERIANQGGTLDITTRDTNITDRL